MPRKKKIWIPRGHVRHMAANTSPLQCPDNRKASCHCLLTLYSLFSGRSCACRHLWCAKVSAPGGGRPVFLDRWKGTGVCDKMMGSLMKMPLVDLSACHLASCHPENIAADKYPPPITSLKRSSFVLAVCSGKWNGLPWNYGERGRQEVVVLGGRGKKTDGRRAKIYYILK